MTFLGVPNDFYPCWNPFTAVYKSRDDRNNSSNSSTSNNNSSSSNVNNDRHECKFLLCIMALLVSMCAIVLISTGLSSDDPLIDFQVNSLEVTSMKVYNISNDYYSIVRQQKHVTADFYFNLTLKSKDIELLYFNPMQVSLVYGNDDFLSSTILEPYILLEEQHQLQFGMGIKDDTHLQNETIDLISHDLWVENVLQFGLKAQGNCVRWHRGDFQNCRINLMCDDIKVGFPPQNNLTTGSMIVSPLLCKCKFDWEYV